MDANRKHPICVVKPKGTLFRDYGLAAVFWHRPNQSSLMSVIGVTRSCGSLILEAETNTELTLSVSVR
jgi:hypothetical protein